MNSTRCSRAFLGCVFACLTAGPALAGEQPTGPGSVDAAASTKAFSVRTPVLEQFVGSWCIYCPDGRYFAEQTAASLPSAIFVELHIGDAMESNESGALQTYYGAAFPQALIDRRSAPVSRGSWQAQVESSSMEAAVVTLELVGLQFDGLTRQVSGSLTVMFTGFAGGDLRPNVWIVEDNVVGSGVGYDQANFYNTAAGHPFEGAGDPIIGYVHNGVVRGMTDGPWGAAGLIPGNVSFGDSYTIPFMYTLPALSEPSNVRLVGVVANFGANVADRVILNATQRALLTEVFRNGFE